MEPLHNQSNPLSGDGTSNPATSKGADDKSALASSMSHSPLQSSNTLYTRSCDVCRKRKVKCNKISTGCSNCAKAQIECHYPGPGRAPRRPKVVKQVMARETEFLKRLRRLEGVVHELSGQVNEEAHRNSTDSPKDRLWKDKGASSDADSTMSKPQSAKGTVRVVGMDEGKTMTSKWLERMANIGEGPPESDLVKREFGKLVIDEGKSHYVNSDLFATLSHEVEDIREIFDGNDTSVGDDGELTDLPGSRSPVGHQGFLFGYSSTMVDLRSLHPLPSQIPFFWDVFMENVDPLTKVLHVPTMAKAIKEAKENLDSLSKSIEALLFAIYYSVVTSMSQEEVKSSFGTNKSVLIDRYRFGVEQALARADFLNTSELVIIQAFSLFLTCVRHHDQSKFVWSLAGLAIRLSIGLGLHRDGSKMGLSPFDTEMRRRLWWSLCVLDVRASEDYGSEPAILEGTYDTLLPLNVNDADLDPLATEPPQEHVGVSDMTFCLIRYEVCKVMRHMPYSTPHVYAPIANATTFEEKEKMVRDLHAHLETKYLQYCLNSGPLHWVAATVSRLVLAKMSIMIFFRGPDSPDNLPQHIRDRLFIASIEINEYSRLLETGAATKKWGWLFHTYVHWHALVYILREISHRPRCPVTDRAWRAVDSSFSSWDDAVKHSRSSKNGMLWLPLRRLMAKAHRKREEDLAAVAAGDISRQKPGFLDMDKWAMPSECPSAMPQGEEQQHQPVELGDVEVFRPLQQGILYPDQPMSDCGPDIPLRPYTIESQTQEVSSAIEDAGGGPTQLQAQFQQYENQQAQMARQQNMQTPGYRGVRNQVPGYAGQMQGQVPWLLEAPLRDLDMEMGVSSGESSGMDDFSWENFDDLVRDVMLQNDLGQVAGRGPSMAGLGSWW
ncbi:hypothetical protein VC83_06552 [Pseudogymnoascus destructans]|uniref:Zn(2)-C6 fungal-type domain-containing protein n=2 Tax=Pseudogymnoascus destructans TaxID=655981 RepID=L8G3H3_PSED2|nr:uncharacterized protein VC83_06552 [Pseudogymnoascus destructans]ELR07389.1 hypothetical protein GMDG_08404 [Pseudogymnoascus destructans 20631-21]OAF58196.1 hypothetical protein VC83_06552 [Pseudogymnoascus destructans]